MKISINWLKDHLDTNSSNSEIVETLEKIGFEVEGIEDQSANLKNIVLGQIESFEKYPDADKLNVCNVNVGSEHKQIVCGANNVRNGMKVAVALPGAYIPKGDFHIKKGKIRGVESNGMMCGADELGLSDKESSGIMDVETDLEIGSSFSSVCEINDVILDLSITPNRGDAFSVLGIARDLSAAGIGSLKKIDFNGSSYTQCPSPLSIEVSNEKCESFYGCIVTGVENKESPDWLKKCLKSVGMRSISALVDISNYFLMDQGRPLHMFDLDKIHGDTLFIRNGKDGEVFKSLDEKDYILRSSDIVIADEKNPHALAGIMGGLESGCSMDTKNVFIECAYFDPATIALSGQHHNILSDARTRFERGIDKNSQEKGLAQAVDMVVDLCGGFPCIPVIFDKNSNSENVITFNNNDYLKITGVKISQEKIDKILNSLGFSGDHLGYKVPSWRHDISIKEDLAEEVLRINGYDSLIETALPSPSSLSFETDVVDSIKNILANRGLQESVSWSFFGEKEANAFGLNGLKIKNPISEDASIMRTSHLPSLMISVGRNESYSRSSTRLFEFAPIYNEDGSTQQNVLSGLRSGSPIQTHYSIQPKLVDVFHAKSDVLSVLEFFGISENNLQIKNNAPNYYHTGRSASIYLGKNCIAHFGEIHPSVSKRLSVKSKRVCAFEIFMENLPKFKEKIKSINISQLQDVKKDMGYIVDSSVSFDDLKKCIRKVEKNAVIELFDLYYGDDIGSSKKAFGLRFTFEQKDKTLSDEEIHEKMDLITSSISENLNGKLRDGSAG